MSIYIKGQDLPKEGECYFLQINSDGTIYDAVGRRIAAHAVPVPPHGRMIDADALMLEIQEYIEEYGLETDERGWHNEKWCAMKEAAMVIDAAPTIIPAEEGE